MLLSRAIIDSICPGNSCKLAMGQAGTEMSFENQRAGGKWKSVLLVEENVRGEENKCHLVYDSGTFSLKSSSLRYNLHTVKVTLFRVQF